MTELFNSCGIVEIIGKGALSDRFVRVRMLDTLAAYLCGVPDGYLVFADTMRYRMDDQPDALDVSEDNASGRACHEQAVSDSEHIWADELP
ncbi:hypothetical protein [Rhizobium sp. L245/93]|uniref:hypothetical protein n=1 Tax=Rhizobium sp. L245/93 TaxID=2819998 RepID=UPI001ADBBE13|nr:hypothetical protein [Rhizobium sp. L245/93]MBO9170889.1 hypothetical protein [Rhizobium sp. L245/93]